MKRYRSLTSLIMVASGVAIALVPASVQAVSARTYNIEGQAAVALSIGLGVLLSAILNAVALESRLANPALRVKSYLPWWSTAAGLAGALILASLAQSPLGPVLALPLLMTGLQLGRTHAISEHRWANEMLAGVVLAGGASVAFALSNSGSQWAMQLLGCATALGVVIRAVGAAPRVKEKSELRRALWVGSETAVVATVPLAMNTIILALISAEDAVAFRMILTVLGVLQPFLGYMRTRLLSRNSAALTFGLSLLTLGALVAVLFANLLGVFEAFFGAAWQSVSFLALLLACAWKAVSIPSTFPFAGLRRLGSVAVVFVLRAASSIVYVGAGLLAVTLWSGLEAVFVAFLLAETVTYLLYARAYRRRVRQAENGPP